MLGRHDLACEHRRPQCMHVRHRRVRTDVPGSSDREAQDVGTEAIVTEVADRGERRQLVRAKKRCRSHAGALDTWRLNDIGERLPGCAFGQQREYDIAGVVEGEALTGCTRVGGCPCESKCSTVTSAPIRGRSSPRRERADAPNSSRPSSTSRTTARAARRSAISRPYRAGGACRWRRGDGWRPRTVQKTGAPRRANAADMRSRNRHYRSHRSP